MRFWSQYLVATLSAPSRPRVATVSASPAAGRGRAPDAWAGRGAGPGQPGIELLLSAGLALAVLAYALCMPLSCLGLGLLDLLVGPLVYTAAGLPWSVLLLAAYYYCLARAARHLRRRPPALAAGALAVLALHLCIAAQRCAVPPYPLA